MSCGCSPSSPRYPSSMSFVSAMVDPPTPKRSKQAGRPLRFESPAVLGWRRLLPAWHLAGDQQLLESRLVETGDAEVGGLGDLGRARRLADHHRGGALRHAAR